MACGRRKPAGQTERLDVGPVIKPANGKVLNQPATLSMIILLG